MTGPLQRTVMPLSSTPLVALLVALSATRPQVHDTLREVEPVEIGTSAAGSIEEIWECLSTDEGMTSFLAPAAFVELRIGGPWEFGAGRERDAATGALLPDGAGARILDYVPNERLSVEWPVPERFPETAGTPTQVDISLRRMSDQRTLVTVEHAGFGQEHEWAHVSEYFQLFWSNALNGLRQRFDRGPMDWSTAGVDVGAARVLIGERRAVLEGAEPMQWVVRLQPRDDAVVTSPSPEDTRAIQAHFERLQRMLSEGSLLLAGPATEPPYFGLVVFETRDRRSAEAVLHGDPAVRAGVMNGSLQGFHVSLVRQ